MAAIHEYSVKQHNYQYSLNADSGNVDDQLNALAEEGWEVVSADLGGFPYVNILWRRALDRDARPAAGKGKSAA